MAKRLGTGERGEAGTEDSADASHRIAARLREALAGTTPFRARVAGIEQFEEPTSGTGPVVYLAVESPGLRSLHERLCEAFPPVEDIEGEAYDPHVTIARGGDPDAARALVERQIEPIEWTVDTLTLLDAERNLPVTRLHLPV